MAGRVSPDRELQVSLLRDEPGKGVSMLYTL